MPVPSEPALELFELAPEYEPEDESIEPAGPAVVAAAVIEAVDRGVVDPHLRQLGGAIRRRERQLVRKAEVDAAARFKVGDRVRLGPSVRPKYLRGAPATVAGWAHKNVLVRLDQAVGRYPAQAEISVPPLGVRRDMAS